MVESWQYQIRRKTFSDDLKDLNLSNSEVKGLKVSDFKFEVVLDKDKRLEMIEFIKKYEWLGSLSQYTTHWFACYYNNLLAGVVLFNVPNAFSKLLGDDTYNLERLISRGACASWTPKNLASHLIMWAIKWMVKNTEFRMFTAYADPQANELGTIYQACNFYYLGNKYGTKFRYVNPHTGKIVSDRYFRQKTAYKRFAKELNISWNKEWQSRNGMNWDVVPNNIEILLRKASKESQDNAKKIVCPSKHKYVYVLGQNKTETKRLRNLFVENNKTYSYPKQRGN